MMSLNKIYSILLLVALLLCCISKAVAEEAPSLDRDPTQPYALSTPREKSTGLALAAIKFQPPHSWIVINQKLLREGESFDSIEVLQIKQNTVKLRQGQKEITLTIFPSNIVQSTRQALLIKD